MRKIDARWQMYDPGKWGRTRMSVATKDYRLMRAVARAAELVNECTEDRCIGTKPQRIDLSREAIQAFQQLYHALDAFNAPGKGRR